MEKQTLHSLFEQNFATTEQETFNFKTTLGKPLVLFFYPKDNTPGCSQEAQDFRDFYQSFQALNCCVIGASRDTLKSHHKFKEKYTLPYPLLSDTEELLCQHFNCIKDKNMFGKKVRGIVRSTYLFNANGHLHESWIKVKIPGHVEAVLQSLKNLTEAP